MPTTTATTTTATAAEIFPVSEIIRANFNDTAAYKNAGYVVYPVCRCHGSGLGNPCKTGTLTQKIESFRRYLFGVITGTIKDDRMYDDFISLCRIHKAGYNVALTCHCPANQNCHSDIIKSAMLWYEYHNEKADYRLTQRATRMILSEGMGSYVAVTTIKDPADPKKRITGLYFCGQTGREHNTEGLARYQYSEPLHDMGLQPRPPRTWAMHTYRDAADPGDWTTGRPIHLDSTHEIVTYGFFNGKAWYVPSLNGPNEVKGPIQYRPESYLARTKGDYHAATRYAGLAERINLPLSFMAEFRKHRIEGLEWHINEADQIGDPEDAMNFISEGSPYVDPADADELATDPQTTARPAGDSVWGYRPVIDWHDQEDEITPEQIEFIETTDDLNAAYKAALNVQSPKLRSQLITTIKHMQAINVRRACKSAPHIKPILSRLLEIQNLDNQKKIKAYLYTLCNGGTWNEKGKKTRFPRQLTKIEADAVWYFWNKRQKQLKKRALTAPAAAAAPQVKQAGDLTEKEWCERYMTEADEAELYRESERAHEGYQSDYPSWVDY